MKFRKTIAAIVSGLILAGSLASCGNTTTTTGGSSSAGSSSGGSSSSASAGSSSSGDSTAISTYQADQNYGTLNVSYPVGNIRVAIDILALQLGLFDQEGVTVNPVNLGGTNALTAINEGSDELDLLTAGFVADLQAIASGYDLCFIAGTAVEGGALIAKKGSAANYQDSSSVINIDAVKNAKLGFVRNEASWIITRQYLLDNGVSADEIAAIEDESTGHITYYGETTETALAVQKGEVDLGFLPMEYALLYADAYDFELVSAAGALQPNYVCCREVTSKTKFESKKDAFIAYETARLRAFEYYKKGESDQAIRENVVKIVSDYSGKEADYVDTYLYGGVTKYSNDPNTNGIAKYVVAAWNSGALSGAAVDFGNYDITQNINTTAYKTALDNLAAREPSNSFWTELETLFTSSN